MEENKKKNITGTALGLLLLASFFISGILFFQKRGLSEQVKEELLKHDSLVSEKLLAEKQIESLNKLMVGFAEKSEALDSELVVALRNLDSQKQENTKLSAEIGKVNRIKKELKGIKQLKAQLSKQIELLQRNNNDLNEKIKKLEKDLTVKDELLNAKNKDGSKLHVDNLMIELLKKNTNKLTVKAKRVRNFRLSFEIKGNLSTSESNIYIVLKDEKGNLIQPQKQQVIIKNEGLVYTTSSKVSNDSDHRVKISVTDPGLRYKGIYKIEIYEQNEGLIGKAAFNSN